MQVIVKSLDCTFVVSVSAGATVADLKAAIEDVEFIPAGMANADPLLLFCFYLRTVFYAYFDLQIR